MCTVHALSLGQEGAVRTWTFKVESTKSLLFLKDNYEEEFEEVITTVRSADGSLEIKREEPSPKRRRKQVMRTCLTKLSTDGALASTSATIVQQPPLSSVNDQPLTPPSSVHSTVSTSPPPPISGVIASKKMF